MPKRKLNDPLMLDIRARYPTKGPDPGNNIDAWAESYTNDISEKIGKAYEMIRKKIPDHDICMAVGLREETIKALRSPKKRKENKEDGSSKEM